LEIIMEYTTKDTGSRESFENGAVRDCSTGKGRYDLISPLALKRLADVYERGAHKYESDRNWEKGMPILRCLESAIRHTYQYIEGKRDEDHLAQAAWNLFASIHFEEMISRGKLDPKWAKDLPDYVGDAVEDAVEDAVIAKLARSVDPTVTSTDSQPPHSPCSSCISV
jgi:hypothetical protein